MSSTQSEKQTLFIASLIIFWYCSNIGVLLLNKLLLSNYGFSFPIFLTMCHMSACAVLSYVSIVFLKIVPFQRIKSRSQFFRIATLSIVFCGSVVGGNISLRYLPVSFNQAVGATTPFFTALFAYLITQKSESWSTYGCLVPVVAGVVIASGGEPSFHLYGFIMCIGATAARAFKSVLQGVLLSNEGSMGAIASGQLNYGIFSRSEGVKCRRYTTIIPLPFEGRLSYKGDSGLARPFCYLNNGHLRTVCMGFEEEEG